MLVHVRLVTRIKEVVITEERLEERQIRHCHKTDEELAAEKAAKATDDTNKQKKLTLKTFP